MNDLYLFPIFYVHKSCPAWLSAVGIALPIAAALSIALLILVISALVCLGGVKPISDVRGFGSTFFPSPAINARDISTLEAAMRARDSERAAMREELATLKLQQVPGAGAVRRDGL